MEKIEIPKAWLERLVELGELIDMEGVEENICHLKGYIESGRSLLETNNKKL